MRSRTSKRDKLGPTYDGLSGRALLEKLADGHEFSVLQAFWRYGDPEVAADAVGPILATGAPHLLEPIVGEVLQVSLGEPFPSRLIVELTERRPQLGSKLGARLSKRLLDEEPFPNAEYENGRHLLELWVLGQDGKVGEDFAIAVIAEETPKASESTVRASAFQRCRASAAVLKESAAIVTRELEGEPSTASWNAAAEFVEATCRNAPETPEPVVPIVTRLIELAPQYGQSDPLPPELSRLVGSIAATELEASLSERLPDTPGARALVRVVGELPRASMRASLFARVVHQQPHLWTVAQAEFAELDEAEWKRRLKALVGDEQVERSILVQLLNAAPLRLVASVIELTLNQAGDEDDQLLSVAAARLGQRLDELGTDAGTRPDWVAAVHWPRARNEEGVRKLASLLGEVEEDVHVRVVVRGFIAEKITADVAARLLSEGASYAALAMMETGPLRGELAAALARTRQDELGPAVARLQKEGYSFDLTDSLAEALPNAAFIGAAEAWADLEKSGKDEVVQLLGLHGSEEQIPVLEAIVRDDHRENADRRVAAAEKIAELTPTGKSLPDCVIDLLRSNVPKLREAAVKAIERVKPRDAALIGGLHEVEVRAGVAGKAARAALDSLADEFLRDLGGASGKEELHEVIPLLGAVGRAQVLPALFNYVGANAEYDDVTLHRAAAKAVQQAAEHIRAVSEDDQEALVGLIDGEEREADLEAQGDLSSALARLQLGDDAALKVLYDELPTTFKVRGDPDELFGPEKERLVRQLGLYTRARDQGEAGWGLALTHLDNVAERLVRAAYLVCPAGSEAIKEDIRTDPAEPEYGRLIGALASVGELHGIQDDCSVLHDIRCRNSEVPHPGQRPDADTVATARRSFKEIAKVCVGVVVNARGPKR